jgi:hypothetical protein
MKKHTKQKPDYLDLDGDGNRTEPMKQAAATAKNERVSEAKQYEMRMSNGRVKKFTAKDDADARRIARGHGANSVIKLKGGVPDGKIMERSPVSEAESGVYRHRGTYGTEYDPSGKAKADPVKRGRGRPRKDNEIDGTEKKYDWSPFTRKVDAPKTASGRVHKMVGETKADPLGGWVAYKGDRAKKFKTREGAKAYAAKNAGYKVASSEGYEKTKKVTEGQFTQHYMDANKSSPTRRQSELAQQDTKPTPWGRDPIAAATDRAFDAGAKFFSKKKTGVSEGSSMRIVAQDDSGAKSYRVYKDADWNEYVVKFYLNGRHQTDADYHTDDKNDAMGTAKQFLDESNQVLESDDGKVYRHKGTYGTEYDPSGKAKAEITKRGRGRPRKEAGADGEVKRYDWSAFGGKVSIPAHKGEVARHKMVGEQRLQETAMIRVMSLLEEAVALEKKMTDADKEQREKIVKGMKGDTAGLKARYGKRWKDVMYATATKQAMKK